jgi:hypothetical protein
MIHCPGFDLVTPKQNSEGSNILMFMLFKDAVPILEVKQHYMSGGTTPRFLTSALVGGERSA